MAEGLQTERFAWWMISVFLKLILHPMKKEPEILALKAEVKRLRKLLFFYENNIRKMVLFPKKNKALIRAYQLKYRYVNKLKTKIKQL